MSQTQRTNIAVARERVVLAAMTPPRSHERSSPDPLAELRSLADTAGARVVDTLTQRRVRPEPGSYFGVGKLHELRERVQDAGAHAVIFDNDLSPSQIRNIEHTVGCKVLDRSELILDIFASRARTHEARLQVELAQLEYTYPRLRAMWSHLERIAGGAPAGIGTRGPGEQQLEIDRRIVQRRKGELKREIDSVQSRKQRQVARRNVDFYTIGLVGYTNAGKSTLFNTLTEAQAYADDKLFATLDTRTRRWELGGGEAAMLSDTVGFVRDLPHHLVASFRATLEESIHSDLLLVVIDISDPEAEEHLATVDRTLRAIGAHEQPRLLVLNKIDELEDNAELLIWQQHHPHAFPLSARTGEGLDSLLHAVRERSRGRELELTLRLPLAEGKAATFLENRARIHHREYDTTCATLNLTLGERQLQQLRATGADLEVIEKHPAE